MSSFHSESVFSFNYVLYKTSHLLQKNSLGEIALNVPIRCLGTKDLNITVNVFEWIKLDRELVITSGWLTMAFELLHIFIESI